MALSAVCKVTLDAFTKYDNLNKEIEKRPAYLIAGDVILLTNLDVDSGIRWLITKETEESFFLTPVDDVDYIGTKDIYISEDELCGSLSIRCAFSVEVEKSYLSKKKRFYFIDDSHLQRVNHKIRLFNGEQPGELISTQDEEDTDTYSVYLDWIENVSYAVKELEETYGYSATRTAKIYQFA